MTKIIPQANENVKYKKQKGEFYAQNNRHQLLHQAERPQEVRQLHKAHRHSRESDFEDDSGDESEESEDEKTANIDEDQVASEDQGMSMGI